MKRIEVNTQTGEVKVLDLTQEEISKLPSLAERKQELKNHLIGVRNSYLKWSSDYHAPDFPDDVLEKRALARKENDDIKSSTTLDLLNKFSSTFE